MASDTYRWLAKYYDLLFELHGPSEKARAAVIGRLLPRIHSACDLGCGTGNTAIRLASRGIETFAVDLSPDMCRIARRKVRRSGLNVTVVCADMREFVLPHAVDLITSEYDAVNHLPRKNDLKRVLRRVGAALNLGGYFAFDVNNRLSFERIWSNTWFLEKDPVAMVMHGGHVPGSDRAWADVEWFVRTGKQTWRRYHEHVEEVCWSEEEMRLALDKAGLRVVRTWDAAPFFRDQVTLPGNRTYWLTQRVAA
ncbi:MAG TPA: class I SAM-dependent methyltransferase [Bryobacteraceae bacterium]|nr:class I SAM-dependent methyltransferase [Bryobacteraceae bacterium]